MEKTATVQEVTNIREWQGDKGTVFYHNIVLDNGDKGSIGKKQSGAIKVGDSLTYTIEGDRIKQVQQQNGFGGNRNGGQQRGSSASFALSYCKDICVAMIPLHPDKTPTDWTTTCLAMADKFQNWLKQHE